MSLPDVSFEGTLTQDPSLRFTGSGVAVCTLSVAVNERKKDDDGKWVNGETTWINVILWRKIAENAAESLSKGDNVVVTGRLRNREWETKEGQKRITTEVEADAIGLSLRFEVIDKAHKSDRSWTVGETKDDPWATGAPF